MNKRSALGTVVGILLICLFLALALAIYFIGPEALLPKVAQGADWVAEKTLAPLRAMWSDKPKVESDASMSNVYDNIDELLRSQGKGPCIVEFKPFPKDLNGYTISLTNQEQGVFIQLVSDKGQLVNHNTISGKISCVVGDSKTVKRFYDNYLDGTPCTSDCTGDYTQTNAIFTSNSKMKVSGEDYNIQNVAFRTQDGNTCFFIAKGDRLGSSCNINVDYLDDDCMKDITLNMRKCSDVSYEPVFYGGTFYGKKNEWRKIDNSFYYAGSDERVPFMFRIAAKDVSLGRKGLVEVEFDKAFSSGTSNIPEAQGVYYENEFYGKKEDWKFISKGILGGKVWIYTGNDIKVKEKFKTEGIVVEQKMELFGPPAEG